MDVGVLEVGNVGAEYAEDDELEGDEVERDEVERDEKDVYEKNVRNEAGTFAVWQSDEKDT